MCEAGPGCEWNHQPLPLELPVQLALLEVLHKQFKLDLVGVKVKKIAEILSDLVVSPTSERLSRMVTEVGS